MADNELLKQINREIKVTSLENAEKAEKAKIKSEEDKKFKSEDSLEPDEISDQEETKTDSSEEKEDSEDADIKDNSEETEEDIEEVAEENIDEISDEIKVNVLSSDPSLINANDLPLERNEIDDIDVVDGILNDFKQDKSSAFIDPDSNDENSSRLKVVDTSLGVFTVLNHDDKSVLLLDCNKQKIQISVEDFNNLHPFEIRDERLLDVNDFKDAYNRDLKAEEEVAKNSESEESTEEESTEAEDEFSEEEFSFGDEETEEPSEEEPQIGESLKTNSEPGIKKKENILSEIQKGLSTKKGVKETIRSDVRSKNRCVLVANKSKTSKDKGLKFNEMKPNQAVKARTSRIHESKKPVKLNKTKLNRKEATQPSAIYTPPSPLLNGKKSDFSVDKVMTVKDGKFVLVKLEGKTKTAYLKLKPKKKLLSINELKFYLNDVKSFLESLDCVSDNYYILEKEIVMKKFRKYESEEVEDLDQELDVEEPEEDDDDVEEEVEEDDVEVEDEDLDDEEDVEEEEESEDEEPSDSIEFSTEINGVKYAGTLHRVDSSEEDDEDDVEDDEDVEEDVEDDDNEEEEDDEDLILQSEEELDDLDFPEGLDESVIKAKAKIYGKRYNVSFCNVKKESVKKAKLEMRKHNIVEAWNALVRGAKSIKC